MDSEIFHLFIIPTSGWGTVLTVKRNKIVEYTFYISCYKSCFYSLVYANMQYKVNTLYFLPNDIHSPAFHRQTGFVSVLGSWTLQPQECSLITQPNIQLPGRSKNKLANQCWRILWFWGAARFCPRSRGLLEKKKACRSNTDRQAEFGDPFKKWRS